MYNEQANKLEETFIIKSTILLRETAGDSERERSPLGALLSVWFVCCIFLFMFSRFVEFPRRDYE